LDMRVVSLHVYFIPALVNYINKKIATGIEGLTLNASRIIKYFCKKD